jgi:hypothetical protein
MHASMAVARIFLGGSPHPIPPIPPLPSPPFPPLPFIMGVRGITPEKIFEIGDARR